MLNRKVAIIDEDKKILGKLEEVLSASGYAPITINDARLAVDTVLQKKPDVIIMELKMPRKNGFELMDTMNWVSETRRVPIIAMSESFNDEFHWLLDLCGINRWIRKPFQPLDLIWAIEHEIEDRNPSDTQSDASELETMKYLGLPDFSWR